MTSAARGAVHPANVLLSFLAVVLLVFAQPTPARAAKFRFGTDDTLHHLQDIGLKGPNGEALYLGYKTSIHSFVAPYSITDEGYILGIKGENRYYALDDAQIKRMQSLGQLPSPLPAYEIDAFEWVIGHMAWLIVGGLAVWGAWGGYTASRGRKAEAIIDEANAHAREGRFAQAIERYSEAVRLAPKNPIAYHNRALAFAGSGDLDKAISDHTTVIRLTPKSGEAFLMRAYANQRKEDHTRAVVDFGSAIRLEPMDGMAYLGRAASLTRLGDHAAALADCEKVIDMAPKAWGPYQARADVLESMGNLEAAAADRARAEALYAEAQAAAAAAG